MKRIVLLLTILTVFSVLSVAPVDASTSVINGKASSVSNWLAYHIAIFLRTHASNAVDIQPVDHFSENGPLLGGDADDYANGKTPNETNIKTIYDFDGSLSEQYNSETERE